ncbi:MAG: glycosyltransferase family 1 protein [Polyangiales bacterium]
MSGVGRLAIALGGTDWGRSGVGVYAREVLRTLVPRVTDSGGSVVALGTPRDLEAYADDLLGVDRSVAPVDSPLTSALWYATWAGRAARRAGADVLLLPAANRRVAFRAGLPVVGVVHDLAQLHVEQKYDPLRMFYFSRVMLPALGTMTRLVAVSEATRRDLVSVLGRGAPPIDVVPNGVDAARFRPLRDDDPASDAARRALGLDAPYLLYASRLEHPGKNHLRLLEAFARSRARTTHLLVLAGKDWGAGPLIEKRAAELGIRDRVRMLGFVDDALLPGLVAGSRAVLMLGLHEGFGLPALEAIAMGKPVCASSTGALPEVVGPFAALSNPFDMGSIVAALERAAFDETLAAQARAEGPKWAESRDWSRTAEGLLAACAAATR